MNTFSKEEKGRLMEAFKLAGMPAYLNSFPLRLKRAIKVLQAVKKKALVVPEVAKNKNEPKGISRSAALQVEAGNKRAFSAEVATQYICDVAKNKIGPDGIGCLVEDLKEGLREARIDSKRENGKRRAARAWRSDGKFRAK